METLGIIKKGNGYFIISQDGAISDPYPDLDLAESAIAEGKDKYGNYSGLSWNYLFSGHDSLENIAAGQGAILIKSIES